MRAKFYKQNGFALAVAVAGIVILTYVLWGLPFIERDKNKVPGSPALSTATPATYVFTARNATTKTDWNYSLTASPGDTIEITFKAQHVMGADPQTTLVNLLPIETSNGSVKISMIETFFGQHDITISPADSAHPITVSYIPETTQVYGTVEGTSQFPLYSQRSDDIYQAFQNAIILKGTADTSPSISFKMRVVQQ